MKKLASRIKGAAWICLLLVCACTVGIPIKAAPTGPAGAVYYVALTGNDSNPGTQTQPWRTIQMAANTVVAGSTVIVNAGTYNETVIESTSGTGPNAMIQFLANGAVTIKAFYIQGDYIELNGFTVTPTDCTWDAAIEVTGNYALIQNNRVQDSTRVGIATRDNTTGAIIRGNIITRVQIMGIQIMGSNQLIENNDISDFRDHFGSCNYGGADAIQFHGSNNTFRGNYIHDYYKSSQSGTPHTDAFQTYSDPVNNKTAAKNTVIERNHIFMGNTSTGQLQEAWTGNSIYGFMIEGNVTDPCDNLIIRNNLIESWSGLNAGGGVISGGNVTGLKIYNNTFRSNINFTSNNPGGIDINQQPITGEIFNNITVDFANHHYSLSFGGVTFDYNLMWNSNGTRPRLYGYTIQPHDKRGVDPRFVSNFNDLHLQAGSPAIDAGQRLEKVVGDFDGNPRPQGARYDIGAYEFPVSSKMATPTAAHMNEIITFTITIAGNGNPMTVTDPLPLQLVYLTSTLTCPGSVTYDAAAQRVKYTGTPPAELACVVQIPVRVNTNQRMAITNSATIDNGQPPLKSVLATVILNELGLYLPILLKSG